MITIDDLRRMVILGRLTDAMHQKLHPLVRHAHYPEGEYIFNEGGIAETFYMLKSGKVLLEQRISDKMTVSIDAIKPGYSFGWSALLGGGVEPYSHFTSDAISVEPCDVIMVDGDDMRALLEEDHTMGYLLTQRLNRVIRQRLMHRTEQFMRIIKKHPDIYQLMA